MVSGGGSQQDQTAGETTIHAVQEELGRRTSESTQSSLGAKCSPSNLLNLTALANKVCHL